MSYAIGFLGFGFAALSVAPAFARIKEALPLLLAALG